MYTGEYSAGLWTPSITFGSLSTAQTFTTKTGWYQRFGPWVTVYFYLQFSNKGTATGNSALEGFPYALNNSGYFAQYCFVQNISMSSDSMCDILGIGGSSIAGIYQCNGQGSQSLLTDANFANTSLITGTLNYFTPV
jgi:hypothetical protein